MEFSIKAADLASIKTPCLVLSHFADAGPNDRLAELDEASQGALLYLIGRDLETKAGSLLAIPMLSGLHAERVLVVSLGKREDYSAQALRSALGAVGKWLAGSRAERAAIDLSGFVTQDLDAGFVAQTSARLLAEAAYRYKAPRIKPDDSPKGAHKIDFLLAEKPDPETKRSLTFGVAMAKGQALARELGDLPANRCTPSHLAEVATELGKHHKFKVETFDRAEIEKLGMGAFLSVTHGSAEEPRFIVLHYKGAKAKKAPVVLVGKGLTFDSGGISLKPGEGMDEMKYDMCGAASVLGTFKAVAEMELPINLVGLIPSTENMPGGRATKPGDVVTSLSGQTVEILNTDAEGRLILCDALTYAERFKPAAVIDIATLTGACVIALGHHTSGLFANDEALARELLAASESTGDRCWQLPLFDEYQEQLKSKFADMANIGGRPAGAITAACFLSRFAKAYKWAHLDIAGTAWKSGAEKGATGRPVALLAEFLIQRVEEQ